ncbi:MAG: transcriptional repressor [Rhodobacteraceae bacterium]|nr:transcriptional repressor [Paracoccaceae bacterium]MCB1367699.1 transcriptional repressor [Paracoccaceae bacterium]
MTPTEKGAHWLQGAGLRPTRQRLALARHLVGDGQDRHVTAESLHACARESGDQVSLATVYNTLRAFSAAGLMTEIAMDGNTSYFDTRVDDHPHYYWEETGDLTDAPKSELRFESLPPLPEGMEITKVDVVIRMRRKG